VFDLSGFLLAAPLAPIEPDLFREISRTGRHVAAAQWRP
jgi:hypothetical protein